MLSADKMTITVQGSDAHWVVTALRYYAKVNPNAFEYAPRRMIEMADMIHSLDMQRCQGFLAHEECVEAIEEAANLDKYTLPRLY
jgi:hypothetical protein